ncbi:MAG: ABC-ATPase domain-containing protein, partial [Lachnospiraceae bacterium]|nr:ABC-ATPase domain-containing protein [Lachnospiraceae bacterium]
MMNHSDLRDILRRIDHRGYPAYKDTRGKYDFGKYVLSIDHVQGDPFAAPSRLSVHIDGRTAGFKEELYDTDWRRVALEDFLLREFGKKVSEGSFQAHGSGKSGLIGVSRPGQEVLKRSACLLDRKDGSLVVRFQVGFPARGRTVLSDELVKILYDILPKCVEKSLFATAYRAEFLQKNADLSDDRHFIREELAKRDLVAFIADGSVLPRKSGVSDLPMKEAVKFQAPDSLAVTLSLPHKGELRGMGVKKGITLIVGGGYHGKSTLLSAIERGVYDHIAGDGREYVITDENSVKLRAEDGRSIQNTDISMFIRNLPNGKDTKHFYTEDASGSTSQAANTVEALEAGAKCLLIDEDTSATNFMIRDELMQRVVAR